MKEVENSQGGVMEAKLSCDQPRDRRQIYNFKSAHEAKHLKIVWVRLRFYHLYITVTCTLLTISSLKQVIFYQTRQSGYETVPFDVYIHNLMFAFILE